MNVIAFYELLGEHDGDNHSVQAEGFSEDQNQNHSDEDSFLLSVSSHTCISDNSNCESGSLMKKINTQNVKSWWL